MFSFNFNILKIHYFLWRFSFLFADLPEKHTLLLRAISKNDLLRICCDASTDWKTIRSVVLCRKYFLEVDDIFHFAIQLLLSLPPPPLSADGVKSENGRQRVKEDGDGEERGREKEEEEKEREGGGEEERASEVRRGIIRLLCIWASVASEDFQTKEVMALLPEFLQLLGLYDAFLSLTDGECKESPSLPSSSAPLPLPSLLSDFDEKSCAMAVEREREDRGDLYAPTLHLVGSTLRGEGDVCRYLVLKCGADCGYVLTPAELEALGGKMKEEIGSLCGGGREGEGEGVFCVSAIAIAKGKGDNGLVEFYEKALASLFPHFNLTVT